MTRFLQATTMPEASSGAYPVVSTQSIRPMGLSEASLSSVPAATARKAVKTWAARKAVKTWAARRKTKRTNTSLGGDEQQLAHPNVTTKTERRHHRPWCGGDDYGLTWGVIGPQAMVWAQAAGRHGQQKT